RRSSRRTSPRRGCWPSSATRPRPSGSRARSPRSAGTPGGGARGGGGAARPGGHGAAGPAPRFAGGGGDDVSAGRRPPAAPHGSGCTHSSVLAAQLALGATLEQAARAARQIASEAVRDGLRELGAGAGPVNVLGVGRVP